MDKLRVLAIEDDDYDALALEELLDRLDAFDVEFIHCADSRAGRHALATNPFDVIFLDYRLGSEDGLEVLRAIRREGIRSPVIFMTGHGNERVAAEAARAGGDDYLLKDDLSVDTVRSSLHRVLEAHLSEESQHGFEETLYQLATSDPITGLWNRRYFMDRLGDEVSRTARFDNPLCLMLLDLDNFGGINEELGRERADAVLGNVAVTLRGLLRVTDQFCRYDGDRFAVALIETDLQEARECADRVRVAVQEAPLKTASGEPLPLTCSIVLRPITEPDPDPDAALIDAFTAIAGAKVEGGNRVVITEPTTR